MTVSALEKKADRLVQERACRHSRCCVCGGRLGIGGHHIIHKSQCRGSRYVLRHDLRNILPLCVDCHIPFAHEREGEWLEWLEENKQEVYQWYVNQLAVPMVQGLSIRTNSYLRETIKDLKALCSGLS